MDFWLLITRWMIFVIKIINKTQWFIYIIVPLCYTDDANNTNMIVLIIIKMCKKIRRL